MARKTRQPDEEQYIRQVEAQREVQRATERLREVESRWGLIRTIFDPIRAHRQDNHFAERLRIAFEGDR